MKTLGKLWSCISRAQPPQGNAAPDDKTALKRCLGFWMVVSFGVANSVGAGVFVTLGSAAASSGPSLILSFVLAGLGCCLSAFCYADFASRVSSSGGAYSYVYASLGEYLAFLTGISLTLAYGVSCSAMARGGAAYLRALFEQYMKVKMPWWLREIPLMPDSPVGEIVKLDLVAPLLCGIIALLCLCGVEESQRVSGVITTLNVFVMILIICAGFVNFSGDNFTDFSPAGVAGMLKAASTVFFSYIGWDAICVLSEEVKEPLRVIPRAIITTLAIVTTIYALMAMSLFGMVDRAWLCSLSSDDRAVALVGAFKAVGSSWVGVVIAVVACSCALNSTYGSTMGQPRVWFSMARDGLLPARFVSVNAKQVPSFAILATGLMTVTLSFFVDFEILADVISAACLLMQCLVCLGCLTHRTSAFESSLATPILWSFCVSATAFGMLLQESGSLALFLWFAAGWFLLSCVALFAVVLRTSGRGFLPVALDSAAPSAGAFVNLFVMASQGFVSVLVLLVFFGLCSVFYFSYSIRHSALHRPAMKSLPSLPSHPTVGSL